MRAKLKGLLYQFPRAYFSSTSSLQKWKTKKKISINSRFNIYRRPGKLLQLLICLERGKNKDQKMVRCQWGISVRCDITKGWYYKQCFGTNILKSGASKRSKIFPNFCRIIVCWSASQLALGEGGGHRGQITTFTPQDQQVTTAQPQSRYHCWAHFLLLRLLLQFCKVDHEACTHSTEVQFSYSHNISSQSQTSLGSIWKKKKSYLFGNVILSIVNTIHNTFLNLHVQKRAYELWMTVL